MSNNKQISPETPRDPPTITWMPCGSLFEDFFDTINVSIETYRTKQTGGWIFNYIQALQLVGVHSAIIHISSQVNKPLRFKHEPTGATISILPSPPIHRLLRRIADRTQISKRRYIRSIFTALDSYIVLPFCQLRAELKRHQTQAIIFQDYENPSFDICVLLGRIMRLPVYASFQGGSRPRTRLEYPTRLLAIRACSGLLIGPRSEIRRVSKQYHVPTLKCIQIFNPFDVTKWQPLDRSLARATLGISHNACVVLFHGRIDISHKGLDILLEAWQQVCRQRPNQEICLLLVGSGNDSPKLRRCIASLELSNLLFIDGYIHDRQLLWQYISAADLYVLPSRYEGFPVAPIEAMACKLPVIATDVNGVCDILGDNDEFGGIIIPIEDPHALANAIVHLIDRPILRKEMGKKARQRVESAFSYEVIGKHLRNIVLRVT